MFPYRRQRSYIRNPKIIGKPPDSMHVGRDRWCSQHVIAEV